MLSKQNQAVVEAYNKGYKIDNDGYPISPSGKKLSVYNSRGYDGFCIRLNKDRIRLQSHRLQAYQKYGDVIFIKGVQVRHKDGNPANNSHENILIGTQSDNMMDRTPEARLASAIKASSYVKKHDHAAIKAYHQEHGFTKTMQYFNISSKGTMSYIINH